MIQLPPNVRVFISTEITDMRRSFDSLACQTREILKEDPLSGHLFVFFNRRRDALKILQWERGGWWLYYRRLTQGTFRLPVSREVARSIELESHELHVLLEGLELAGAKHRARFFRESL